MFSFPFWKGVAGATVPLWAKNGLDQSARVHCQVTLYKAELIVLAHQAIHPLLLCFSGPSVISIINVGLFATG